MHSSWYVSRPVVFGTLISFVAALLAPPARVLAQDGSAGSASSYEEARDELAAVMREVRQHRDRLDESGFSPAAKVRALGTDPAALFRYVRDEIAFEPYRGVVRFAAGALMSQAANACDRSLLLGAMLREAGHEVRYAFAQLPDPMAERLAGAMRPGARLTARLTPFPVTDGNTDLYRSLSLSDAEIEARPARRRRVDGKLRRRVVRRLCLQSWPHPRQAGGGQHPVWRSAKRT